MSSRGGKTRDGRTRDARLAAVTAGAPITGGRLSAGERAAMLAELLERGLGIRRAMAIVRKRAAALEPRACQESPFAAPPRRLAVAVRDANTSGMGAPAHAAPPAADPSPSPGQVALAAPETGREPAAARPAAADAARRQRRCLRCRQSFLSAGRHNHLCQPCGALNARQGDDLALPAVTAALRSLRR